MVDDLAVHAPSIARPTSSAFWVFASALELQSKPLLKNLVTMPKEEPFQEDKDHLELTLLVHPDASEGD